MHYVALLFLGTLGWGVSLYLVKLLLHVMSPEWIVFYRMLIASITLLLLSWWFRVPFAFRYNLVRYGVLLGIFNMSLPYFLTAYSEMYINSSLAAIINGLTPFATLFVAKGLFASTEKITKSNLVGLFMGLIGIVLIEYAQVTNLAVTRGVVAMIVVSLCYAVAAGAMRGDAKNLHPIALATVAAVFSTVTFLLINLVSTPHLHGQLSMSQMGMILWLGVIGTAVSLFVYCWIIQQVGALFASMVTYCITVTSVVLGVLVLHERFTQYEMHGCILLFVSLIIFNHGDYMARSIIAYYRKNITTSATASDG